MTSWKPPARADAGAPLIPVPGAKALAALPSTGRMPILQGIVLFFGMVAVQIATGHLVPALVGGFGPSVTTVVRAAVSLALVIGVFVVAVRLIGARPTTDFEKDGWAGELAVGLVLGAVLMTAVVAVAWMMGAYRIDGINGHALVVQAAAQSVLAGITEEMLFRAGLLRLIEHRLGTWWALALTSLLFGAAHLANPEAGVWAGLAIMLEAGLLLGACYVVTRRLWMVIGVHAAWNFVQGGVFSSDVSGTGQENTGLFAATIDGPWWVTGGQTGFEGSVTAVVVCLVVAVALMRVAHRRRLIIPVGAFRHEAIGPCGPIDPTEGACAR
ncbi:CPBP family intramembrane metalloprotease [Actinomyces sp. B33]|uniref:CPBP family intramembrane glutamic endopeptidase n=1 Tax=Actinomyces sp. B33 TaxID=2942131 RepID=UPI002341E589|nr:type II CAAX endopeptidase family protein [Actinomyces sp. B33]MDC4233161.1 CPBP family intramembrane metalloprotease [Actinomyces sp. B33]